MLIVLPNCKKDCKLKPVSKEDSQMRSFATANGIIATQHPSGMYYEIVDSGSGAAVSATSKISITYSGKFLSGETFDEQVSPNNTASNPAWPLDGLIEGWKVGIPLIRAGGRIRLIVPSSMAYGCEDYYSIPGNSILFFDITLVEVH